MAIIEIEQGLDYILRDMVAIFSDQKDCPLFVKSEVADAISFSVVKLDDHRYNINCQGVADCTFCLACNLRSDLTVL